MSFRKELGKQFVIGMARDIGHYLEIFRLFQEMFLGVHRAVFKIETVVYMPYGRGVMGFVTPVDFLRFHLYGIVKHFSITRGMAFDNITADVIERLN